MLRWLPVVSLLIVSACSAPQLPEPQFTSGQPLTLPLGAQNLATIAPPKGCQIADAQTWAWLLGQDRAIIFRLHRGNVPEGGGEAYVNSLLQALGKSGEAGVERDEPLKLGDLDARAIEAVELRKKPAMALWMVVAEAEDGLYSATAYGERDDLQRKAKEVRAYLASLRISPRAAPLPAAPTITEGGD